VDTAQRLAAAELTIADMKMVLVECR